MRLLRVLVVAVLAVLAGIAGLFVAAAAGLATALVLFVRRLLRPPGAARLPTNAPPRARANAGEVIDVTATELPVDSTPR